MSFWTAFAHRYPGIPSLRVDGGSIFSSGVAEASILNRWVLEGAFDSKLDALNLTAWDLPVWREMGDLAAAGQVPAQFLNMPLVSGNVTTNVANFPKIQRHIVKEHRLGPEAAREVVRIGVTGLLFDPQEKISRREFQIQDYQAAARRVIEELTPQTDYRVILTDLDIGRAISLAIQVPGINLILVAHNYDSISEPQQVGETLIVIPVNEGRMISEVRLAFPRGSDKIQSQARFVPLDKTVPDDVRMGALVQRAQLQLDGFKKAKP